MQYNDSSRLKAQRSSRTRNRNGPDQKKIRGKLIGTILGLAVGGPPGAAIGLIIGHAHDNRPDDALGFWKSMRSANTDFQGSTQQAAFTMGVIVLGAKVAKADGRVTRAEIEAFKRVFRVQESQVDAVGRLFNQAVRSLEGFEPYAFQLAQMFRNRPAVLEEVLGGLFIIAAADTKGISDAELRFLSRVAVIFSFSDADFFRIAARAGINLGGAGKCAAQDESHASCAILGLRAEKASIEEIKKTYRALIRTHHPDKLVAQGMAPEFIATATEKMKRINGAYDVICSDKGIK